MKTGWLITLLLGMLLSLGLGTYAAARGYLDKGADQQTLLEISAKLDRLETELVDARAAGTLPAAPTREGLDSEPVTNSLAADQFLPPAPAPALPGNAPPRRTADPAASLGPGSRLPSARVTHSAPAPADTAASLTALEPVEATEALDAASIPPASPTTATSDDLEEIQFGAAPPPPPAATRHHLDDLSFPAGPQESGSPASHLLPGDAQELEPVIPDAPHTTRATRIR